MVKASAACQEEERIAADKDAAQEEVTAVIIEVDPVDGITDWGSRIDGRRVVITPPVDYR